MLSTINSTIKDGVKKEVRSYFKRYGSQGRQPFKRNFFNRSKSPKRSLRKITKAETKVLNALTPQDPCFYCGEKGHPYRFCPKKPNLNDKNVQKKISEGFENWKRSQTKKLHKMHIDSFIDGTDDDENKSNTSFSESETDQKADDTTTEGTDVDNSSDESDSDEEATGVLEFDTDKESVDGDPTTTDDEQ